nr:12069_t:CDS:2 [Entrophospora candida]
MAFTQNGKGYANSLSFDSEMFVEGVEDIGDFFEDLIPDEEEENYSDLLVAGLIRQFENPASRRCNSFRHAATWMDEFSGDGEPASSPLLINLSYKSSKSPNNPTSKKGLY